MIETTVPKINVADVIARVKASVTEIHERERQQAAEEQRRAAEEQRRAAEEQRRVAEEQRRAAQEQRRALEERRAAEEHSAQQLRAAEEELAAAAQSAALPFEIKPPPAPHRATPVDAQRERLLKAVKQAQESTEVKSWIPKPLRRFFRRQSLHNRLVLDAITVLAKTNAQLATRVQHLSDADHVQHGWLTSLGPPMHSLAELARTRAPQELVDVLRRRLDVLDHTYRADRASNDLDRERYELDRERYELDRAHRTEIDQAYRGELDRAGEHLRHLQDEVDRGLHDARVRDDARGAQLAALSADAARASDFVGALAQKIDRLAEDLAHAGAHLRNLQVEADRLSLRSAPLDTQIGQVQGQLAGMREEMNRAGEHVRHLDVELRRALDSAGRDAIERKIGVLEQRLSDDASFLKTEISQHRLTLSRLLSSDRSDSSVQEPSAPPAPDSGLLDAFYVAFEDRFRGRRSDIKDRVRVYLPLLRDAAAGNDDRQILDLGCGRGEWLELLQEEKMKASGVDLNAAMVAQSSARGLQAIEADALLHLQGLPDASLGAVTGFHLIEHLPFEVLMHLLGQTLRVLQPGGIAIFESPNCKNLVVGASTFNLDPTHRNPVFPETAEFMLQLQGFTRTELRYLAPAEGSPFDGKAPEFAYLNERFFGPQDFSVIGYKARA